MSRFLRLFIPFVFVGYSLYSQQNTTLFFLPNSPQANFVNPAVTNDCKLIIGIPVLSSIHLNAGNSGFSMNQVLRKQSDNTYVFDGNSVMQKLGKVNHFDTELSVNLLFAGFWYKNNYLTFSVNERADMFLTYPRDLFALIWNGNTQFEGETAKLGRSGIYSSYHREFALGIAREAGTGMWWGARGKLLFGKMNATFVKSNIDLFTDPVTFDLDFTMDWALNTSLPMDVIKDAAGDIESVEYNGSSAGKILFNRKNIGFSTDLGFIKEINEQVTVSGSALDLGFISWKDNGYSFTQKGNYSYQGPLGDTIDEDNYFDDLMRVVQEEFGVTSAPKTYTTFLNPRFYLGATYRIREDLSVGLLGTAKVNRFKTATGVTLSLNKAFSEKFSGSVSYSYMYRSLKNVGLGFKAGRSPLQFYMVSDNVLGFISPYGARNVNMRFGLMLNFGCGGNSSSGGRGAKFGGCGCEGMERAASHRSRMNQLVRKKR